jgi:hypothetical protein
MVLGIELDAELGDEIELRLQKIDVLFFVVLNFSTDRASHNPARRGNGWPLPRRAR